MQLYVFRVTTFHVGTKLNAGALALPRSLCSEVK